MKMLNVGRIRGSDILFPLALFSFSAVAVKYTNWVFTTQTRWLFLGLLAAFLLIRRGQPRLPRTMLYNFLAIYIIWCCATTLWSGVPQLSATKSIAFAIVAVTFTTAGQLWVKRLGVDGALLISAPFVVLTLFAGLLGRGNAIAFNYGAWNEFYLFQGLTGNPNMFGILCLMALPYGIWQVCQLSKKRLGGLRYWVAVGILAALLALLVSSHSRAAMLAAALCGLGWAAAAGARRVFALILVGLFGATVLTLAFPETLGPIEQRFVLKGATEEEGFFFSRRNKWEQSFRFAQEGGWIGGGYGVTIGDASFAGGLSAVGYGREKGSSQLAIIEETGVVGLGLYVVLLLTLFGYIWSAMKRARRLDLRIALGITIGALAGMTAHSVFEAWWVAPGSPESAYFWALTGVAIGLAQETTRRRTPLGPGAHAFGSAPMIGGLPRGQQENSHR